MANTAQHMAHRDLRLENIYLAFDGHIRIADLGAREVVGVREVMLVVMRVG